MSSDKAHITDEEGQALVEFALVLPVLILVLFGAIHFGRAFNYWNDETHLTAEAARFAAVNRKPDPSSALTLQQQIKNQADAADLKSGASVCVSFPNSPSGTPAPVAGDPVQVRMSFVFNWIPLIGTKVGVGSTTITSSTVMRLEAQPTNFAAGCA
jgi:hypothetical protein